MVRLGLSVAHNEAVTDGGRGDPDRGHGDSERRRRATAAEGPTARYGGMPARSTMHVLLINFWRVHQKPHVGADNVRNIYRVDT